MRIEPKFPKLQYGEECDGRALLGNNGEHLGLLRREVDWVEMLGTIQVRYTPKITGYIVECWADPDPANFAKDVDPVDQRVKTLAEATFLAKKIYARY